MRIFEIGTGYTSIPADKGAATEIVIEGLTRSLLRLGYDVMIVDIADSARLPTDLPIVEASMPKGFDSTDEALGFRHKLKRVVYSLRLAKKLREILRSVADDERVVLHFHNQYNAFFFLHLCPPRLRRRACVAYTNHSGAWNGAWDSIRDTINRRYFMERYAQRHSDVVFVLNPVTRKNLIDNLGIDSRHVVELINGVDTQMYRPASAEAAAATAGRLFFPGATYVFQCGSICENKGQLRSLRALLPLMRKDSCLCYAYAGGIIDEDYASRIKEFAESEGIAERVRYLGELAPGRQLAETYTGARCMLLPSGYESFSLVTIESLSCGVPVVINAGCGIAFLCGDDHGAFSYERDDEFTEAIAKALGNDDDQRREIASSARSFVERLYSWDSVARRYVDAFEETVENRS